VHITNLYGGGDGAWAGDSARVGAFFRETLLLHGEGMRTGDTRLPRGLGLTRVVGSWRESVLSRHMERPSLRPWGQSRL